MGVAELVGVRVASPVGAEGVGVRVRVATGLGVAPPAQRVAQLQSAVRVTC